MYLMDKKFTLLWDLDGTLIDSRQELVDSIEKAILRSGLDLIEGKEIVIGPTINVLLDEYFGENVLQESDKKNIIRNFRATYDYSEFNNTKLYNGIGTLLESLSETCKNIIITNKPPIPSKRILKKLNIEHLFDDVLTPYSFNVKKNKSEVFREALRKHNLQPENCLSIGDMKSDYNASSDNEIEFIAVLWGSGRKDDFAPITDIYQARNAEELDNLINLRLIEKNVQ